MMKTVDRNSATPIFYQLQEIFHDNIDEGIWKSGEQIPTENELCKMYDVSLITVRKALKQLELEGLIKCFQGKGTFVEDRKVKDMILQSLTGTFAFTLPDKRNFSTTVVDFKRERPSAMVKDILQLEEDDNVFNLIRIRSVEGEPLYWTKAYLPEKLCPDLLYENLEERSLYEILKSKYGLVAVSAVRTIETQLASSRAKNYLNVVPGTPINMINSISYMEDGRPLEYSKNYFRSDRVKFEVKINL